MQRLYKAIHGLMLALAVVSFSACEDRLEEPDENTVFSEDTDYTNSDNMLPVLIGAYEGFYTRGWENHLLIGVRGDDVNAAGDQVPLTETDLYRYDPNFWLYNSTWEGFYGDILNAHAAMEELSKYKEFAPNPALADQYIAEIRVMRAYMLLQVARLWGDVYVPQSSEAIALLEADVTSFEGVMQHISEQMDLAIPNLPTVHPNQRTDIRGGMTVYTAYAVKALANLEINNWQAVADATSEIIGSGEFSLEPDFYSLFKLNGKLNDENILELQFSDFGQGEGDSFDHLYAPYGPSNWTPAVESASGGWGFYEPSLEYIKFMLDRDESVRLETSVLFTPAGIEELQADPAYSTLPDHVSSVTRDGDQINNNARALFSSGKHYLPSNQLTPGRTRYGSNKNFQCIRYAEMLLVHAEALVNGANSSVMSADEAVNAVRNRAGFATPLSGVTLDDVLNEKLAELGMEWGNRFYDMVRHGRGSELDESDRTFDESDRFLPYPQNQVDQLPKLNQ
ncbi:RagB/SusD family nutrient uptake outer membrane protein [Marinoscillum furvescens]|uniref:Putative outer membrane starch-binding protein n=1 Tax=Marinoscillum furvescens DSM 4134 TaxID=1122208 RepID=A0A3D9L1Z0_MARFU|nr:RagB/SusD family nutrient uptake outer membrane protein [Marinoscillum furvescens]RED96176.1 putative outer membrane starch-binding protein [Marinoscillum furvescens DSM 4134]